MNLARCDECCNKLDGINGDTVYLLNNEASKYFNGEYEHLCEDCLTNLDDENKLCIYTGVIFLKALENK